MLLHSLERNNLIEDVWNEGKRTYRLTQKGIKTIDAIFTANDKINGFITNLLKVQPIL